MGTANVGIRFVMHNLRRSWILGDFARRAWVLDEKTDWRCAGMGVTVRAPPPCAEMPSIY